MQDKVISSDRLLSRAEVEVNFGLSRRFLEVSAVRGDGPPMVKIGRSVRYRVADLRAWIEARRVNSTSEEVAK
ncbi:AlpA family transcriptional regulator [Defluviimonas aestuarii]|uniref:helix-turn-helix transcriptional regulator n=1 Tax=Albidovulum aestuarii TaxID=1130726 RepID=UPI00249A95C3|nr:helix-turn-helix domain-containing protein [Defluviimonas aestuarii]MDI3336403.1 AlpA family transcriptional regulator [Defluviimonas aestuarii]